MRASALLLIALAAGSNAQAAVTLTATPVFGQSTSEAVVWAVRARNATDTPINSIDVAFQGSFLNGFDPGFTFKAGPELPRFGLQRVPESFFVLPEGFDSSDVLATEVVDTGTRLGAAYTLAGDTPLIPAGALRVPIATLSVPRGVSFDLATALVDNGSFTIAPLVEPDFNGDGRVDLLDLDILGRNFGSEEATLAEGDSNLDGAVDLFDLFLLGESFELSFPVPAIPEPACVWLASLAMVLAQNARNRRG